MTDTTTADNEPGRPLGLPLNDQLGPFPWGDDLEAWLEVSDTAQVASDIRAYALRERAAERERCAKLCDTHRRSWPMDGPATADTIQAAIRKA